MKYLIAIKSCLADFQRGCHDAIRTSWGMWVPQDVDLKFFTGHHEHFDDEVALDCADDYASLPYKTQAICAWSRQHGYDYTFLCDNDTFVHPERLFRDTFEFDYKGRFYFQSKLPWACQGPQFAFGGTGYWLSSFACGLIAGSDITEKDKNEDQFVGRELWGSANIKIKRANMQRWERYAAWHYTKGAYPEYPKYDPQSDWMTKMTNHHILGIPEASLAPIDKKTFPDALPKPLELYKTNPLLIVAKMNYLYNSSCTPNDLVSLAASIEIQSKEPDAITTIEWEALGRSYFLLGDRAASEKCYAIAKS